MSGALAIDGPSTTALRRVDQGKRTALLASSMLVRHQPIFESHHTIAPRMRLVRKRGWKFMFATLLSLFPLSSLRQPLLVQLEQHLLTFRLRE